MGIPKDYFKATKKYEKISLKKVLKGKPEKTLTPKTVNKYITNISATFDFAVRHGYMETNYARGIKIRLKGDQRDERDPFSNEDLTALFHSKEYTEDTLKKPWQFWLPILGLFTGCRREELCQLHLKNIKPFESVWILDIREDLESGQKTKSKSSNRSIPLHPFITKELNFIEHVNRLKEKGEARLFPEFRRQSGRYGHYFGRWFKEYKEKCGIISEPSKKVFHSFRHNLQDNLKQNMVLPEIIDELVGHVHQGQTMKRYTKQYRVQILYEKGILKLNYELDLSHLKNSKFVVE
jgi:integrase